MFSAEIIFYGIIGLILFNFIFDLVLSSLNVNHFKVRLPEELDDIYDPKTYQKSQDYKQQKFKFSLVTSSFSTLLILAVLFTGGFSYLHYHLTTLVNPGLLVSLCFFGVLFVLNFLMNLPFEIYGTFVIESKFGFNTTTLKTFVLDQLKSILLSIIIGGSLLTAFYYLWQTFGVQFWWYASILVGFIMIFINLFYTKFILPLFNQLSPLPKGDLRTSIEAYAQRVNFNLERIFVIDGSKRSKKANAFFSGFGAQKQVTLYDTLITDLSTTEVVAVLAHEVGHYKHKHIIYNLLLSLLSITLSLYLLALFLSQPEVSQALGVQEISFHIGLIAFAFIYSPVSFVLGLLTNVISRKFEYQADAYARVTYNAQDLIQALKKLSRNSLSNLTPHPWYVYFNYSHPTLLQRFRNLKSND